MFPEFRYKDGVFFLNVASSDTSTMALQVAKNSEGKSLWTFDMHDADMKNSVTITLGKDLWKMNLNTPDLIINSDWNGSTTLTEISVSRLMKDAIYSSFDNGLNRQEFRDLMPDKFRIYGNLTSNAVSLKFDADASTFATIDSFTNGSNSNYRLYFNMFGQKIEFSWDLSQNYGTFSIERPQDAIDLDTKKHQKIQKSLGWLDGLMSR